MKLTDAIDGFSYHLSSNGKSPSTIRLYTTYLKKLDDFLIHPELEKITRADIMRYYGHMRSDYIPFRLSGDSKPLAAGTIQNIWISIRSFYNWAEQELHIPRVDGSIEKPEFDYPEIAPFSQADIRALLKASEYNRATTPGNRMAFRAKRHTRVRDQAIIILLLDTGIRVSEAARLHIKDVNFKNAEIFLEPFGSGRKTKSRHIPIGNTCRKFLWSYISNRGDTGPNDSLLITRDGSPMDRDSIRHVLSEIASKAGVTHCHPHRFRHTFAIEFLRNGGDVFSLQKILGHSTLEMVNTYLQLASSDVAAAHRRASPADNLKL